MPFLTPETHGELDSLRTFAMQQLSQIRASAHGLSDEQINASPTASSLTIAALLRHTGGVALMWSAMANSAPKAPEFTDEESEMRTPLDELVNDPMPASVVLERFDRCVGIASANLADVQDLGAMAPAFDAPWLPDGLEGWEARWCILHLIAEVARHAGHADFIREAIDGKTAFELNELQDAAPGERE